jgi:hypothetical protein
VSGQQREDAVITSYPAPVATPYRALTEQASASAAFGCLLHMVKSHRNPLKFVPSLISQASKLTRTPFGEEAYRGDIDDLRNALLHAAETVKVKTGRAVLILDALDELEAGGERIAFLPEVLPAGVRAILTCRPDIPLVQALRSRLRHLEERSLPPLAVEDLPLVPARPQAAHAAGGVACGQGTGRARLPLAAVAAAAGDSAGECPARGVAGSSAEHPERGDRP